MDERNWTAPIDAYCERDGAAFWAEPVNAVSNLAFIVAALAALVLWLRAGGRDRPALALIGVTTAVGIGSFLFHTYANRWSLLADVLPITVFIYGYFFVAMRRFLGLGLVPAAITTLGFFGFSFGFVRVWTLAFGTGPVATANGSISYFPAAIALLCVGAILMRNRERGPAEEFAGRSLLLAAGLFCVSLVFRSIDFAVCERLPVGTHFLWHLLNAAVLFVLLRGMIDFRVLARGNAEPGRVSPASSRW